MWVMRRGCLKKNKFLVMCNKINNGMELRMMRSMNGCVIV